jgi:hypothetical protein
MILENIKQRTLKNSPTVPVREWGIGYIVPYLQFLSFRNFLGVKFHGDGEHQTTGGAQGKRHKNTKGGSLIFLSATLALKKVSIKHSFVCSVPLFLQQASCRLVGPSSNISIYFTFSSFLL